MKAAAEVAGNATVADSADETQRHEYGAMVFRSDEADGWYFLGNLVQGSLPDSAGRASTNPLSVWLATPPESTSIGMAHSHPDMTDYSPKDLAAFDELTSRSPGRLQADRFGDQRNLDFQFSALSKTHGPLVVPSFTNWSVK